MNGQSGSLGLAAKLVQLAEPSPAWSAIFSEEAAMIEDALKDHGAAVEHCGSTSVPGIPAKPILDILVGIRGAIHVPALEHALLPLDYEHAHWAGVPGHEVFGKGNPRTHLVHVVPLQSDAWKRMLTFRDALRKDDALAAEYALLKRQLAARFPTDRPAYTDGKTAFVQGVLAKAG